MNGASPFYVLLVGPLSDGPVGYLGNMRRFCDVASELTLAGFCPINPAPDALEVFASPALTIEMLQRRTLQMFRLAALAPAGRRAALCLGTHNGAGQVSRGSMVELSLCADLSIPIVTTLDELFDMRGTEP